MATETTTQNSSGIDMLLTLVSLAILVGGIVGFYMYPQYSVLVRALGVIAATVMAAFVFTRTSTGSATWNYIVTSRTELRKVVWPTRQESMQTTFVVILFTVFLAVYLWLVDMVLFSGVAWVTGRGDV